MSNMHNSREKAPIYSSPKFNSYQYFASLLHLFFSLFSLKYFKVNPRHQVISSLCVISVWSQKTLNNHYASVTSKKINNNSLVSSNTQSIFKISPKCLFTVDLSSVDLYNFCSHCMFFLIWVLQYPTKEWDGYYWIHFTVALTGKQISCPDGTAGN